MLNDDVEGFRPSSHANYVSSSSSSSFFECSSSSDNRNLSSMNNTNSFEAHVQGFSMGVRLCCFECCLAKNLNILFMKIIVDLERRKMQRRRRRREQEQELAEETVGQ